MDKRFFLCLIEYKACIYILLECKTRCLRRDKNMYDIYRRADRASNDIPERKEHMPSNNLYSVADTSRLTRTRAEIRVINRVS